MMNIFVGFDFWGPPWNPISPDGQKKVAQGGFACVNRDTKTGGSLEGT